MMYQNFGKRVRQQRILSQLTQEKLAEKADISISFLGHIERGTRKASLDTVVKLANALHVSPNILLQDSLDSDLLDFAPQMTESQKGLLREITNRIIEYGDYNGKQSWGTPGDCVLWENPGRDAVPAPCQRDNVPLETPE